MTTNPDQAPDVLDRLWDDITPDAAPIADLLASGHAASRRKRRGRAVAGAVAAVLLIGAGSLVAGGGDDTQVADAGTPELSVDLVSGMPQRVSGLFGGPVNRAAAIWNADEKTLVYLSGFEWSSSCPPEGSAVLTDAGVLVLELDDHVGGEVCTADAGRITATVSGLTGAPAELIVKTGGSATAVPIAGESFDAAAFTLDCESDMWVTSIPDYFGEVRGLPTPVEAVQRMLAENDAAVVGLESPDGESVDVALLRADGSTRAVVSLNRVTGGWIMGASDSCAGEPLGPRRN